MAVTSRSEERRRCFEEWIVSSGVSLAPAVECQVLLNATPQGLRPDDPLPMARDVAPGASVAFDMVYLRGETAWVRAMRAAGLRAADGREMLVGQGAAAFERWFPGVRAPVEVMRAAVRLRSTELTAALRGVERWLLPASCLLCGEPVPPADGEPSCAACAGFVGGRCRTPSARAAASRSSARRPACSAAIGPLAWNGCEAPSGSRDRLAMPRTGSSTTAGGGSPRRWRSPCGVWSH